MGTRAHPRSTLPPHLLTLWRQDLGDVYFELACHRATANDTQNVVDALEMAVLHGFTDEKKLQHEINNGALNRFQSDILKKIDIVNRRILV